MKILITLIIIIFSFSGYVFAETYYCSYEINNNSEIIEIKRIDNNSFNQGDILFENNKFIYIGEPVEGFDRTGFRIAIIDKILSKFRMTVMYDPKHQDQQSAVIEGNCKISN